MNKYYKGAAILWAILSVISYLLWVFVELSFEPSDWSLGSRGGFAVWFVLLGLGCFSVAVNSVEKEDKESRGEAPDADD